MTTAGVRAASQNFVSAKLTKLFALSVIFTVMSILLNFQTAHKGNLAINNYLFLVLFPRANNGLSINKTNEAQ